MSDVSRPALRWHGGKWLLAPWILGFFPKHRVYVEPFGGAASVLIRKDRSYSEVYNDLDDWVVNLFRVLRDRDQSAELLRLLRLTPFSRTEFDGAREIGDLEQSPVESARRLILRSFMGFGSNAHNGGLTGFRANSNRSGTTPAHDWANYSEALPALIERLRGIVIENRDAMKVMVQHDGPETLHYVDPPYLPETRVVGSRAYRHEMTVEAHEALLTGLRELTGMVVLSGYPAPLYDKLLRDWSRFETSALADGARPRTEVLWLNPQAAAARESQAMPLFAEAAA